MLTTLKNRICPGCQNISISSIWLSVLLVSCSTYLHAQESASGRMTKIVAHRGKVSGYPENSLSGLAKALTLGVDYIEVDVRTTSDGVPVVLHDGELKRTTHVRGNVNGYSFSDLEGVPLKKKRKSIRTEDEHIPTLEQMCAMLAAHNRSNGKRVNLYVDCKDVPPETLVSILKRYDLDRTAVFYGNDDYLKALRELLPHACIIPALRTVEDLEKKMMDLKPYGFDVAWNVLNEHTVRQIQSKHVTIYTDLLFLRDRRKNYRKAQRWGITAIQTNRAKKAVHILREK